MKSRMYTFYFVFSIIIVGFSLFTYKCYSSKYQHVDPLASEYQLWAESVPSIGFNGGSYTPADGSGFTHASSAYNSAFWAAADSHVTGTISSRYRCPFLNWEVGGVAHSYHMYGFAADVTGQPYSSLYGKFATVLDEHNPDHVHIDSQTY